MSDDGKGAVARRPILAALGALVGIGAVGTTYGVFSLLGPSAHKGAYEDLISLLPDRDNAAVLGRAVLAGDKVSAMPEMAHNLRRKIGQRPLSSVLSEDVAQGRVVETAGWVLPETLARLCALAAKAA